MKTKIYFSLFFLIFSLYVFCQDTININENQKKAIEIILKRHYKFSNMTFEFKSGIDQTFFKKDSVELNNSIYIKVDYSDKSKNIQSGIKVLLIELKSTNYKEYSEFRYVDYKKAGYNSYPGGMTNNGFGWHKNLMKSRTDKAILEIIKVSK